MRDLFNSTAERAMRYLETLNDRKVAPASAAIDHIHGFAGSLPDLSSNPEEVIKMLDEMGSPATMAMAGPRFFGF